MGRSLRASPCLRPLINVGSISVEDYDYALLGTILKHAAHAMLSPLAFTMSFLNLHGDEVLRVIPLARGLLEE
jgi:hypothetical protein